MVRFYRFAGVTVRVVIPEECSYRDGGIIDGYRTEGPGWDRTLELRVADSLPAPEGKRIYSAPGMLVYLSGDVQYRYEGTVAQGPEGAYIAIRRKGNHSLVWVLRREVGDCIPQKMILDALEAEHQIVQSGGFLLHASCIRHKGRAILFTAPSGTGKSTQADLWCRLRDAELLNGDKAAVMMTEGSAWVHGIPYAGSSNVSKNETLPLGAIVSLSQAPETKIDRLKGLSAFRYVWEGCCVNVWNRDDMNRCMQTVMEAVQCAPVFQLACTPDESAVIALEKALKEAEVE